MSTAGTQTVALGPFLEEVPVRRTLNQSLLEGTGWSYCFPLVGKEAIRT